MENQEKRRAAVAVLGTLAEFHKEPIPYDMKALVALVTDLNPDLLCLDMTAAQWNGRDFAHLPPEYREGLLPLAYQTDIVVVALGEASRREERHAEGAGGWIAGTLRRWLAALQRGSPGPAGINQGLRHHIANLLYDAADLAAGAPGPAVSRAYAAMLAERVLDVARRNEGSRILVVVNVRQCHLVRRALRRKGEVDVVRYQDL